MKIMVIMEKKMRKLATIRKIDNILPIPGADAIECAVVGGWKVVVKKGEYQAGDLGIYCEIDSWIPHALAPFLSKGREPRVFEGVEGERLRTVKLRGQISQGLLLPTVGQTPLTGEGDDLTEFLGIKKWEKALPAQLAGQAKGNFPTAIPKTDQERVQNLVQEIALAQGDEFEVTEKLEGSSMTCYLIGDEFGVCSRNLDLKETEGNSFWATARAEDIEAKMRGLRVKSTFTDFAVQGELIGPGIQGNIYNLSKCEFRVFDVYDIQSGEYLNPFSRNLMVGMMELRHVPVIDAEFVLNTDVDGLLNMAESKSELADVQREGLVFKQNNGGFSFKAISNAYLINER
jgi:RNA ligase (TIGR02306 family)